MNRYPIMMAYALRLTNSKNTLSQYVLWGQPIKLIQVASNSELCENQWNVLLFLFPLIASGPQKPQKLTA